MCSLYDDSICGRSLRVRELSPVSIEHDQFDLCNFKNKKNVEACDSAPVNYSSAKLYIFFPLYFIGILIGKFKFSKPLCNNKNMSYMHVTRKVQIYALILFGDGLTPNLLHNQMWEFAYKVCFKKKQQPLCRTIHKLCFG